MILMASLVKSSLFLIPSLTVEIPINHFFIKQTSSAECSPRSIKLWNPQTATWIIESGYKQDSFSAFIGHKSYHAIESLKKFDSFDYVGIQYSKEFK